MNRRAESATAGKEAKTRRRFLIMFILLYAVWAATYTAIAAWTSGMETHSLDTALDRAIPFIPEFVFVYVFCYVLPFAPFVARIDGAHLRHMILAFCLTSAVTFACFLLFPVYCPRPKYEISTVATHLLSFEHAADRPVNNFPSFHVAVATLVYFGARYVSRFWNIALLCAAIGIAVSALCVKQHFLADVIAGYLLAFASWKLTEKRGASARRALPSRVDEERRTSHGQ